RPPLRPECPASRPSPARWRQPARSRAPEPRLRAASRRDMLGTGNPVISRCAPSLHLRKARLPRKERVGVLATELIGPYTLLRVERNGLDPGAPGQFFMLEAPGRLLPRPMSLCLAPPRELTFLIDPVGPGTKALCALEPGEAIAAFGPL